ncbi:hypothetical protein [Gilvibacter sediminis]|uniref:hypothetical protein n=1 Tax=Gilvibacter sediminis TaxID=379071 RepID=UPI0023509A94|nr:hypothetical protein [Gilvibacter sediminis]MDC7998960.1 hypothetical protein [Gilvibacter sediminis]
MKKTFITLVMLLAAVSLSAQEKSIDFKKGTLEICTSSKIQISGYDGDQVVIKSNTPENVFYVNRGNSYVLNGQARVNTTSTDSISYLYFSTFDKDKKEKSKGLTPLGSTKEDHTAIDMNFDIQKFGSRLTITDKAADGQSNVLFVSSTSYEILVPNSVKLVLDAGKCKNNSNPSRLIFSAEALKINDYAGELMVSSQYKAIELTDVSGPALVNTLGGDVKVVFDKKRPDDLFSIISNDGDIDITMPAKAKVSASIVGQEILSNLDFKIIQEEYSDNQKMINAELNGGGTKLDIRTDFGTIYLRKQ